MTLSQSRIAGAAAWAAYGTVEVVFAVYLRRLLFAPAFVPPHAVWTLLLLVLYPLAGALLGRFAVAGLAVLFAANAIATMDGAAVAITIVIAVTVIALRVADWTAAAALIGPLWIVRDVAFRQSYSVKAAAAAGALIVVVLAAMLAKRHGRSLQPATTIALFAVAMLGTLFVRMALPRDLPPQASPRTAMPNILLILMDTVRADHLSVYGYARDTTPHLERFAQHATLYRRAYAPSNMTLATTASLFTGLFGSEHTAHFDAGWPLGRPLPPSATTLAELLAARGYATASIAANHAYLGREFGLDQGFQHLDARPAPSPFGVASDFSLRRRLASFAERALPARLQRSTRAATEITDLAQRYLSRIAGKRRPFFLAVNYMDAHEPYVPPAPYDAHFPGRDPAQSAGLADHLIATMNRDEPLTITPRERAHLVSQYDGGIAYEDAEIARLIDTLRARNIYDQTLIVIVSDHGESFGEHGLVSHGASNYEQQVRVPFVVKRAGQTKGAVVEAPVSTLEAWSIMNGDDDHAPFPVITEAFPMHGPGVAQKFRHAGRAKIEGTLKTIVNVREPIELYDLARDPAESRNLGRNATSARMSAELSAWLAAQKKQKALPPRELDPETIRRLRALGYLQ